MANKETKINKMHLLMYVNTNLSNKKTLIYVFVQASPIVCSYSYLFYCFKDTVYTISNCNSFPHFLALSLFTIPSLQEKEAGCACTPKLCPPWQIECSKIIL